ncbi:IS3 family transposase [Uruburuella testudinis]|uniref:IS3 family transposase n=1 Tax=Uruburuella testudinis TaxID=1282863 RepID=A0ABY4DWN2_9NEIS|nr:IS3 family transposase [Uruburuella testudinis]UOO83231.1 IS3 family transposase [Uruburuella testudinis]
MRRSRLPQSGERLSKKARCADEARKPNREKARIIEALKTEHPLKYLCESAELSHSSFYFSRKSNQKPDKDQADMEAVYAVYQQHKGCYGQRRIATALSWNTKKAARLMKKMNLKAIVRAKRKYHPPAMGETSENLLKRNFSANTPDEKWLTDVTEFKCDGQKLYLSPILDLYNREIRSYHLSRRPNSEMVTTMLSQAVAQLGARKPMLHSDQGVLYRCHAYREQLAEAGITQSMSRKGNCWDNAPMESFFAILKTECFYNRTFASIEELEAEIHDYIRYYNYERLSLNLKKLSPVAYRTQFATAA